MWEGEIGGCHEMESEWWRLLNLGSVHTRVLAGGHHGNLRTHRVMDLVLIALKKH